jgi:hypothetical protein
MKRYILIVLLIYLSVAVKTQTQLNPVFLTIPFLLTDVNLKTGGMGETGVASTGSAFFTGPHQNPSLLAKAEKNAGFYFSCIPQVSKEIEGEFEINILSFYKLNEKNVLGIDFTFGDHGRIYLSDSSRVLASFQPREYFVNLTYAHRFNNGLSAGSTVKYIYSDLVGNSDQGGEEYSPARTLALDLGMDYEKQMSISDKLSLNYDLGMALENLGPKVSYTNGSDKYFLPAKVAIGLMTGLTININEKTSLITSLSYQAEKLLVPTPPEYYTDSIDRDGNQVIKSGKELPSFVPLSWIQSFYDAPGGIKEEWHEVLHKAGAEICLEYTENFRLALRCGRHYEHWTKSRHKYNTLGAGVYIHGFTIDAKWIPGGADYNYKNSYGLAAGLQLNL